MTMLLGGSSNNSNVFACPRCFGKTRHIKISYQEAFSEMGNAARVIGGISDITGIGKISSLMLNCHYWKCTKCATITIRKSDGTIRRILDEFE